ncbi:MAG: SsrA-binding protein SmpB [Thermodesulfobacteriota bacterium]
MKEKKSGGKSIAKNKKAYHEYQISDVLECGMVLKGPEVKSIRAGRVNLKDSYAVIKEGEVWVHNMHVSPYKFATHASPDPLRKRKLLLHKREINKLIGKTKERGFTLIPVKLYFNKQGRIKLGLGLAKGKTLYDKRQTLKKKEANREMDRIRKEYR